MIHENIKKAVSLTAFGYLFIFLNINLDFGNVSVNILPEWLGWLLLYFASLKLQDYIKERKYIIWFLLAMSIYTLALYLAGIMAPEFNTSILNALKSIIGAAASFLYLGVICEIADEAGSVHSMALHNLRWFNAVISLILGILALVIRNIDTAAAIVIMFGSLIALAAMIITAVVLFRFRREIKEL